MSIRTVHLVGCDRCHAAQHIPLRNYTPAGAREDARQAGWTGPTPEVPAAEDLCPDCVRATTGAGPS